MSSRLFNLSKKINSNTHGIFILPQTSSFLSMSEQRNNSLFPLFPPRPSLFPAPQLKPRSASRCLRTRKTIEIAPFSREKQTFFKKIAFFFVFSLDNAQLGGYIELTLNLEECP